MCAGVLVLHAPDLKKKEQEKLAEALSRSSIALCPEPCLAVPVSAAVWMLTPRCADSTAQVISVITVSAWLRSWPSAAWCGKYASHHVCNVSRACVQTLNNN